MDTAMAALTAAAAMATPIIELKKRSRMMVSLPQRIFIEHKTALYGVPGCRIGTFSLLEEGLFRAPSMQQSRKAIVSFDAARLVKNSVLLVALLGELLFDGPRPRPHGRIFYRHGIFERGRAGARPTLDQVQILARALKIGLRAEVRHVDDEA